MVGLYAVFCRKYIFKLIDLKLYIHAANRLYIMPTNSGQNRFISFWFLIDLPSNLENREKNNWFSVGCTRLIIQSTFLNQLIWKAAWVKPKPCKYSVQVLAIIDLTVFYLWFFFLFFKSSSKSTRNQKLMKRFWPELVHIICNLLATWTHFQVKLTNVVSTENHIYSGSPLLRLSKNLGKQVVKEGLRLRSWQYTW